MERSHRLLLLLLVVGIVGLLAAEVAGHEPESCDTAMLALHINGIPYPVTEKDRGGASCEAVRSGVDSSLAAAASGVTPCLCLLDDVLAFLVTGFSIADVPAEIYTPCGGQHIKEAQLLAEKCDGVLAQLSSRREEEKDKDGAVEAIRSNTDDWVALCRLSSRMKAVEDDRSVALSLC